MTLTRDAGDHFAHPEERHPCPSCGHDDQTRGPIDCACCWRDIRGVDVRRAEFRSVPFRAYPAPLSTDLAGDETTAPEARGFTV